MKLFLLFGFYEDGEYMFWHKSVIFIGDSYEKCEEHKQIHLNILKTYNDYFDNLNNKRKEFFKDIPYKEQKPENKIHLERLRKWDELSLYSNRPEFPHYWEFLIKEFDINSPIELDEKEYPKERYST